MVVHAAHSPRGIATSQMPSVLLVLHQPWIVHTSSRAGRPGSKVLARHSRLLAWSHVQLPGAAAAYAWRLVTACRDDMAHDQ